MANVPISNLTTTWNNVATAFTGIKLNVTDTTSAAASLLMDLQVGGSSKFKVSKTGVPTFASLSIYPDADFFVGASVTGAAFAARSTASFLVNQNMGIGWTDTGGLAVLNADLILRRDAANTLAQRNGVNAQTFRLYNTFTDASNYERGFMRWNSNVMEFGTEAAGTGTLRRFLLQSGNGEISFGNEFGMLANVLRVTASNSINWSSLDNNVNNGFDDTGLSRPAAGVLFLNNGSTGGAAFQLSEMTAPAAPATNGVRIYAEDDGAGKTRLMARFATGAAVQIAIEP